MTRLQDGCGKVRYESRAAANMAIANMAKHKGKRLGKAQTYACAHCGGWHWGHQWRRYKLRDRGG
jgi:hypothetical protein